MVARTSCWHRARDKLRSTRQQLNRANAKVDSMHATIEDMEAAKQSDLSIDRKGSASRYMSASGLMALAVRRNLSNISSADFGSVIVDDVSRWTITRAEILLSCALQAWSHDWHARREQHHADFVNDEDESEWCLAVHVSRADATNSRVWHQSKLMAAEVESFYTDSYEVRDHDTFTAACDRHVCWTDMQVVRDASGVARSDFVCISYHSE